MDHQDQDKIFMGTVKELPIAIFQANGPRPEQQDNLALFKLDEPMSEQKLRDLFNAMAAATKDFGYAKGGAAVNLIVISGGKIMAANLGDSMTALFTRLGKESDMEAQLLSTFHTPGQKAEQARIAPLVDPFDVYVNGPYITKRDGDHSHGVTMTRSLGNTEFAPVLIQDPCTHTLELDASKFDYAQIALYTDGITNTVDHRHSDLAGMPEYLGALAQIEMKQQDEMHMHAAHALGYQAMRSRLTDNATAMSLDLKALPENETFLLAVFDGHGPMGREITEAAIEALRESLTPS